jgi:hypothetical protein
MSARKLGYQPRDRPPSLRQMHNYQTNECKADVGMNRVPDVQDG